MFVVSYFDKVARARLNSKKGMISDISYNQYKFGIVETSTTRTLGLEWQ